MKTQGSLAEQDFPRLVQALHERRWTGVLTLTHAGQSYTGTVARDGTFATTPRGVGSPAELHTLTIAGDFSTRFMETFER